MNPELAKIIGNLLEGLQYGEIKLTVQNGKVLDVVKSERLRLGKT